MTEHFDIAVVGGGAAGLTAAVAAAAELSRKRPGTRIALLEAGSRVGRKLLATGNGRCNLTNTHADPSHYHGDTEFLPSVLERCPPGEIVRSFESLGLLCREREEGRVYPYNLQASAVLEALRRSLDCLGVETRCDFPVEAIRAAAPGFDLSGKNGTVRAERVVLATGGLAYPQLGANGSGYALMKAFGHTCTSLFPALVQVKTEPRRAKPLKGARNAASATLLADSKPVKTTAGEVQFTEHGLSGICIFELSRLVGEWAGKKKLEISLDLMPEYSAEQIAAVLERACRNRELPVSALFDGCLNRQVGPEVVKAALPHAPSSAGKLNRSELALLAGAAKRFRFPVLGTLSWKDAQVTAGGVPLREVDGTMQSRRCPGLYLAGELLNIDGDCGGYNLHWAWSTGLLAGRAAAASL